MPKLYFCAVLQLRNIAINKFPAWSETVNGILCTNNATNNNSAFITLVWLFLTKNDVFIDWMCLLYTCFFDHHRATKESHEYTHTLQNMGFTPTCKVTDYGHSIVDIFEFSYFLIFFLSNFSFDPKPVIITDNS